MSFLWPFSTSNTNNDQHQLDTMKRPDGYANKGTKKNRVVYQTDYVSVDKAHVEKLMHMNAVYFTGVSCGDNNSIPLYLLPESDGIENLTSEDYTKLMEYLLNKMIVSYQNAAVTTHKDKLSILIDRKSFGYGEADKILNGFEQYIAYFKHIYYIGPSKFYGFFSMWTPAEMWEGKVQFFPSFFDCERHSPDILTPSSIPAQMGGALVHNWYDYGSKESAVVELFSKLQDFKKEFKAFKSTTFLETAKLSSGELEKSLAILNSKISRTKVEILDQIENLIEQWKPLANVSSQSKTLVEAQNSQLFWIAGKAQTLYSNMKSYTNEMNRKLSVMDDGNLQVEILNKMVSKINESIQMLGRYKFSLNGLSETLELLKSARMLYLEFEDTLQTSERQLSSEWKKDFSTFRQILKDFGLEIEKYQGAVCNSILLTGLDLSQDTSQHDTELFDKLKVEINSFLTESTSLDIDEKLSKALRVLLKNIQMPTHHIQNPTNELPALGSGQVQ